MECVSPVGFRLGLGSGLGLRVRGWNAFHRSFLRFTEESENKRTIERVVEAKYQVEDVPGS